MPSETTNDVSNGLYEEVFDKMRKVAEANLKMQQDLFQQWNKLWPGLPSPQNAWLEKIRDFQHQWGNTISDLARKKSGNG